MNLHTIWHMLLKVGLYTVKKENLKNHISLQYHIKHCINDLSNDDKKKILKFQSNL